MIHVTVSGNVTIARGLLFVPHAPNANNWKDTSKYPKTARAKSPAIKPILPPQDVQPISQDVQLMPQHVHLMSEEPSIVDWFDIYE